MLSDLILASVLYSNYVPANLVTNKAEKSHYIAAQSSPTPNSDSTAGKMIAHSIYNLTLEARIGNIIIGRGIIELRRRGIIILPIPEIPDVEI